MELTRRQAVVTTTLTPTSTIASSTGTAKSTSVLAEAAASTHLSWWQLLCVCAASVLAAIGGLWFWWRHRKRKKEEEKKKKVLEAEQKKIKESKDRDIESDYSEDDSEDYDSISDGGTIRPSRRQIEKRRAAERYRIEKNRNKYGSSRRERGRHRYVSDSESDSSDSSSVVYRPHNHSRRGRSGRRDERQDNYHGRRKDRERSPSESPDYPPRRRRSITPPARKPRRPPSPSPSPPAPKPKPKEKFRDSVFSSYTSMKNAAVKLKYVEAKVKLKKQLQQEEAIEAKRKQKIREANQEIEDSKRKMEAAEESSGSLRPLIPPARPPTTHFASDSGSARSTPSLPTPPQRAVTRQPVRRPSGDLDKDVHQLLGGNQPTRLPGQPLKSALRLPPPSRKNSGNSIPLPTDRSKNRPQMQYLNPPPLPVNQFEADWLAHPSTIAPARSDSVYLPITPPRDRPRIPPGGLAPAPPPVKKSKGSSSQAPKLLDPVPSQPSRSLASVPVDAVSVGPEKKWANRLRERR